MEISRQNYEQYFIDYLDGNLNKEQVGALMSFLEFNPDLKDEFAGIGKISLIPDETAFSGKAGLLRSESDLSRASILKDFDVYCISSLEHDIACDEETLLLDIIRNDPDREETYRLYQSTRLIADESMLYPGKAKLKKRFIGVPSRIILPAAAAVAALLIIFQVFTGEPEPENLSMGEPLTGTARIEMKIDPSGKPEKRVRDDVPLISGGEETNGKPLVQPEFRAGKQTTPANASIIEAVPDSGREKIQLSMIRSKTIQQLERSTAGPDGYRTASQALQGYITPGGHDNPPQPSGENSRLSLWILADASVRALNSVMEDEYYLDRERDKNGKIRRVTFDTPIFGISAPIRNPDKQR